VQDNFVVLHLIHELSQDSVFNCLLVNCPILFSIVINVDGRNEVSWLQNHGLTKLSV